MSNFILNELVTCDDQDRSWMNCYIKYLIVVINDFYKKFVLPSRNMVNLLMFKNLQNLLLQSIHKAKQNYFNKISKKICDPLTSTKHYQSLLKTILNGKKVPCISLIFHNNKYVTDLKKRVKFLTLFFADECSLIPNNHILPSEQTLTSCDFSETDILQIINSQDSNKAHGLNMTSICMLQLCSKVICRPLNIIFKICLNTDKFPSKWQKGNDVPIHKKDDKQNAKNYRPVSLLPICGKIIECLIYVMYDLLSDNNLLSPNQLGFRSSKPCINKLFSINYEILNAFDKRLEVCGIFLDISKAFDKVWHDGLILNCIKIV